jgi:hypothetical protein
MDRKGLRMMVNLTGGRGSGLDRMIRSFNKPHGALPDVHRAVVVACVKTGYPQFQAEKSSEPRAGARGLKVLKTLGLYLGRGRLGPARDDRRPAFRPDGEACAAHNLPVAIHIADPVPSSVRPIVSTSGSKELNHHPDWSFPRPRFPTFDEPRAAARPAVARHPHDLDCAARGHHAEDLGAVAASLDRFPNVHVEIGARIGELGRQPRTSRRFFDRVGSNHVRDRRSAPRHGDAATALWRRAVRICYRFLETEDEA